MVLYPDHGVVNSRVGMAQPIFDPEIISADDTTMMISGIELAGAEGHLVAEHVQVWRCEQVVDPVRHSAQQQVHVTPANQS